MSSPPIQTVLEVIRKTLADGPADYRIPDFLASVDWSDAVRPQSVVDLLGRLELWDSEYREGDIGWDELAARLGLLAATRGSRGHLDFAGNSGGGPTAPLTTFQLRRQPTATAIQEMIIHSSIKGAR